MTWRAVTKYKGTTICFLLDRRYQDSEDPGEWNNRTEDNTQHGRNLRLSFLS